MKWCLFNHFHSNRTKNMRIIQIPKIGGTCIKSSHASLCTNLFSYFSLFSVFATPPPALLENKWPGPYQTRKQQGTPFGINCNHQMWFTHESFSPMIAFHYLRLDQSQFKSPSQPLWRELCNALSPHAWTFISSPVDISPDKLKYVEFWTCCVKYFWSTLDRIYWKPYQFFWSKTDKMRSAYP